MPAGGNQAIAKIQNSNLDHETFYLAGRAGNDAAIAAVAVSNGEATAPVLVKIADGSKVNHVFVNESEKRIFGTMSDENNNVDIFEMKVDRAGIPREGTLKVTGLTSASAVTSVELQRNDSQMHMLVETPVARQAYIVFDLIDRKVVRAAHVPLPSGPHMSMLAHVGPQV